MSEVFLSERSFHRNTLPKKIHVDSRVNLIEKSIEMRNMAGHPWQDSAYFEPLHESHVDVRRLGS